MMNPREGRHLAHELDLMLQVLRQTYWFHKRSQGLITHSDHDSQCTSKTLRENSLKCTSIRQWAMWELAGSFNVVVERFFGSLKHDWILKTHHETRDKNS